MTIPLSWKADCALSERPFRLKLLGRFIERYRKIRRKILIENAQDYRRSKKVARALEQFKSVDVTSFSTVENVIGAGWRPFRVEHNVSSSLRGNVQGRHGGLSDRSFYGTSTGAITPNLLDSSSAIFLVNDKGETMRAILPSAGRAKEMLVQVSVWWRLRSGYELFESHDTHTSCMLHAFAASARFDTALMHPETIDMIDVSCQKPMDERPVIEIKGEVVQTGVALISAITVNGQERTFIPSGYFRALTRAIQHHVPYLEEPKLIAA